MTQITQTEFIQQNYHLIDGEIYHKKSRKGIRKEYVDKPIMGAVCNGYMQMKVRGTTLYVHRVKAILLGYDITGKHVHHKNHCKDNNEPSNLTVLTPKAHSALH